MSPEAIAQLVAGHREFPAFLERRVESRAAAEDNLQSAFARGLEKSCGMVLPRSAQRRDRSLPAAVHSARAREALGREFAHSQPEGELRQEICRCVSALMAALKPEYRDALKIVDLEDGKLGELAERSGITAENAAVSRWSPQPSPGTGCLISCITC